MTALLFSILLAISFAIILRFVFKRNGPGPGKGLIFYFLIIFLFTFSIGGWLVPIGPVNWDLPWVGYPLLAMLITFLVAALLPKVKPRNRIIERKDLDKEIMHDKVIRSIDGSFSIFFWIMITTFLILAIVRYLIYPT
jgi:hypothetical protein